MKRPDLLVQHSSEALMDGISGMVTHTAEGISGVVTHTAEGISGVVTHTADLIKWRHSGLTDAEVPQRHAISDAEAAANGGSSRASCRTSAYNRCSVPDIYY